MRNLRQLLLLRPPLSVSARWVISDANANADSDFDIC